MPPLKCCGKTWSSGSDDFVVSSLLSVVLHIVLLGGLIVLTVIMFDPECFPDKRQKDIVFAYTCSQYAIQVFVLVSEGLVGFVSSRGTVIDDKPRHLLPHFLCLRAFLYFVEVLGCVLGGYLSWDPFIQDHVDCQSKNRINQGIRGYVLSSMIMLVIIAISFLIYFDPFGLQTPSLIEELDWDDDDDEYDASKNNDVTVTVENIQRSVRKGKIVDKAVIKGTTTKHRLYSTNAKGRWLQRVKVLLCCVCNNDTRSTQQALQDIAHSMAVLFEGDELVLSDFVAGLMLVYRDQKERKKDTNYDPGTKLKIATYSIMTDNQFTPGYKMDAPHDPVEFQSSVTTKLLAKVRHYLKFAIGIYGWPAHVYISPLVGTVCMCTRLRCKVMNRRTEDFYDDNCCLCNTAAMQVRSELTNDEDMIYLSFENQVHLPPFSLCFDHPNKAVVLSIRGSMSLKDALTDLNLSMTSIRVDDVAYHDRVMKVHSGMLRAAKNIKRIIGTRLMEILRSEQYHDYKLIITGHSLGAGVGAVLAVLYHSRYRDLHCYAFSPPGSLFTLPVVEYSKSFITTVIYGNDIVPRMTFRGLLYLKRTIVNLLKQCQLPKHAIIFPYLFCCYRQRHEYEEFDASNLYNFSTEEEGIFKTPGQILSNNIGKIMAAKKSGKMWLNKAKERGLHKFVEKMHAVEEAPAFVPGKVLYIRDTGGKVRKNITNEKEVDAVWESNEAFCHIIVDADMFDHHLPDFVISAIDRLYEQKICNKHKVPHTAPSVVHYSKSSDKQRLVTAAVNPMAMEDDGDVDIDDDDATDVDDGDSQLIEVEIHSNPADNDSDIPLSWL